MKDLDQQQVLGLIADARLSRAQCLALWCYLHCIVRLRPSVGERVQRVQDRLGIRPSDESVCRSEVERALTTFKSPPSVSVLVNSPPEPLRTAVTEVVSRCIAHRRGERKSLIGLIPTVFQHQKDREALERLNQFPVLSKVFSKVTDFFLRTDALRLKGNCIRVTADSIPWLAECYRQACTTLDIENPPPLYLESGGLAVRTLGVEHPVIIVQSMAVALFDAEEMIFLLGRELGRVLAGHARYLSVADAIRGAAGTLGPLAIVVDAAMGLSILSWSRHSELTGDRAGYLACQNHEAALRVLLKLSGYPSRFYNQMFTQCLVDQAREFRRAVDESALEKMFETLGNLTSSYPLAVHRAAELLDWVENGGYDRIIYASPHELQNMSHT